MNRLPLSYKCGVSSAPLIHKTIGNYFDEIVEQHPHQMALVVRHQDIRWTYREYQEEIDKLATGLLNLGIRPGDRVGIWGPNSYEWCLTQYATAKIGAILVCINPAYRLFELEYALNSVGCRVIIAAESFKSSEYLKMLQELAPELALKSTNRSRLKLAKLPQLEMIIRMGDELTAGMINFSEVCKLGKDAERRELRELAGKLQPDDPINIQFTSGTTGSPKGAALSHCNLLNNAFINARTMGFTHQDKLCIPVPLYHCFGMVVGSMLCVSHGATAVFPGEAFDPVETLKTVEEEKCTALHGVPTMFIAELDHPDFSHFELSTLRTGMMGGAPCPTEVMNRVMSEMNMEEVIIVYGQTETSPVNHATLAQDPVAKRVSTVGRVLPGMEAKIIDEEGRVTPIGQKGEICVRGHCVMLGYWDDEERTLETIDRARWLHTGDVGVMDKEGYVTIAGRSKDVVIRGGENIYPREIEEFLYTHPKIQEVQVFGVHDAKVGEELCAWIKLQGKEMMKAEDVQAFCKDKIAHFKIPRYIQFVKDYPMTVTGKIQKFKMAEMMSKALAEQKSGQIELASS